MQTVNIQGMSCEACIKLIKRRFGKLPGVHEVIANDISGKVQLSTDINYSKEELQTALNGTDYKVLSIL